MKYEFDATIEPDEYSNNGSMWEQFSRDGYPGGAIVNIDSGKASIQGIVGKFDSNGSIRIVHRKIYFPRKRIRFAFRVS